MKTAESATNPSDADLIVMLKRLVANEREATTEFLRSLIEFDARRLYLGEGHSSLFAYCTQVLHYAEHAALNRIEVARAARRLPVLLEHIAEGRLHLTGARLLAPHLTDENADTLLSAAGYKTKREIEELIAALNPRPDAASLVRKLPAPESLLERKKFAAASTPRRGRQPDEATRHIPAAVRRAVWRRDGGQCNFVGSHGRCEERGFLEFHHLVPFAVGGAATVENIELRCRAHNAHETSLFLAAEDASFLGMVTREPSG